MAIGLEVIFTGLALFCLDEGTMCQGPADDPAAGLDTVYLVNAWNEDQVCGEELMGGHRPLLVFDEEYLAEDPEKEPAEHHEKTRAEMSEKKKYEVVPAPGGGRLVVLDLTGQELCICAGTSATDACPKEDPVDRSGARPESGNLGKDQQKPSFFRRDEDAFAWLPPLKEGVLPDNTELRMSEMEEGRLGSDVSDLVASRIRLHRGAVGSGPDWTDADATWWEKLFETGFEIWTVDPINPMNGGHFPKALPGLAQWEVPGIPTGSKILIQSCPGDVRETLFQLRTDKGDVQLHVSNSPVEAKAPRMLLANERDELEHFRWYYQLVNWAAMDCPDALPIPYPEEPRITKTIKCPPASSG